MYMVVTGYAWFCRRRSTSKKSKHWYWRAFRHTFRLRGAPGGVLRGDILKNGLRKINRGLPLLFRNYSPRLADKVGLPSSLGIPEVARRLANGIISGIIRSLGSVSIDPHIKSIDTDPEVSPRIITVPPRRLWPLPPVVAGHKCMAKRRQFFSISPASRSHASRASSPKSFCDF